MQYKSYICKTQFYECNFYHKNPATIHICLLFPVCFQTTVLDWENIWKGGRTAVDLLKWSKSRITDNLWPFLVMLCRVVIYCKGNVYVQACVPFAT